MSSVAIRSGIGKPRGEKEMEGGPNKTTKNKIPEGESETCAAWSNPVHPCGCQKGCTPLHQTP